MRKDALIFYQTLPKQFLKEINGDQCVECVWGYWTDEQPGMVGGWVGGWVGSTKCNVLCSLSTWAEKLNQDLIRVP